MRTSRKAGGDWDESSWISSQIGFYRQTQTNHAQSDSGQEIFHSGAMTVKLEKYYHKTKIIKAPYIDRSSSQCATDKLLCNVDITYYKDRGWDTFMRGTYLPIIMVPVSNTNIFSVLNYLIVNSHIRNRTRLDWFYFPSYLIMIIDLRIFCQLGLLCFGFLYQSHPYP